MTDAAPKRTLEDALETNFRDGTLSCAVRDIANTVADPLEASVLHEAADRLDAAAKVFDAERIRDAFRGHGVAVREKDAAPIPGEPFISIADAVRIISSTRFANPDTHFEGPVE